jgi:hypothetical protein
MTKTDAVLKLGGFLIFAEEVAQELAKHDKRAEKLAESLKSLKKDFLPMLEELKEEFDLEDEQE